MKIISVTRSAVALCVATLFLAVPILATGAGSNERLPEIIKAGFDSWSKGGGVDAILNAWQKGGLMEGSNKASGQARYFRSLSQALGSYRSYEAIQSKAIGRASQVIYLSINFERAIVYARFLVYRTDKDWVVQNMDFSDRPEAIMPWLALESERAPE